MCTIAHTHILTNAYTYAHKIINVIFYIKIRISAVRKVNTYRPISGQVFSVVTAVLHHSYGLMSYSQAQSLRVRPVSERQRAQLWDSMDSVVAMGTAKWCPNDPLSHSPTTHTHFLAIVQLPLVHTFPLLLCHLGRNRHPKTSNSASWKLLLKGQEGGFFCFTGATVLHLADEGKLSLRKNVG